MPDLARDRAVVTALLRLAADGRADYARTAPDDQKAVLEVEANTLRHAAEVAAGDLGPMYSWMPSWRWDEVVAIVGPEEQQQ